MATFEGLALLASKSTVRFEGLQRHACMLNAAPAQARIDDRVLQRAAQCALRTQLAAAVVLQKAEILGIQREAQIQRVRHLPICRNRGATEHETRLLELPRVCLARDVPRAACRCAAQPPAQAANVDGEIAIATEAEPARGRTEVELPRQVRADTPRIDVGGVPHHRPAILRMSS